MEIEDDFIKRLKEEEALLRVKAESLGIMIDLPEEEPPPKEEEPAPDAPAPPVEPAEEGARIMAEEEPGEEVTEEKDRFTLFLEDLKQQRRTLEGGDVELSADDLLAETEDVLMLFTKEYLARHIEEARTQHARLTGTPLPPGTDVLSEKKIRANLAELESRIEGAEEFMDAVPAKKAPPPLGRKKRDEAAEDEPHKKPSSKRALYEDFLARTERFIQEWPATRLTENLVECEDAFGRLLEEGKALPAEEEEDIEQKILENLEAVQNEIIEAKKIKYEDRGRLILKAIRKLKDGKGYNPSAYNNVALKFQNLAPDLPDEMRDAIKQELAECYSMMKELEAKRKQEEHAAQAEGIRVYWGTYLKKIDTFVSEIEKARPVEIMDYYIRYKKLVAEYERMNKEEISDFEREAAQDKLDECYDMLEHLRLQT